jgi:hypothetical protein
MAARDRVMINNTKHTLHRLENLNSRLSSSEDERFRSIIYKIIEEPF